MDRDLTGDVIAVADDARSTLLRWIAGTRIGGLVVRRQPRIALRASLALAFAFVLAATFPALSLAVGPLVFGVPHVAASLRYLVLRRGAREPSARPSRAFVVALVIGSIAIVSCRIAAGAGVADGLPVRLELPFGAPLFPPAVADAAMESRRFGRAGAAFAVLAIGSMLALRHPLFVRLAFVHVHNLGVIALWAFGFRRRGARPTFVLVALFVALAVMASGATVPLASALGGLDAAGVSCRVVGEWLAPSLPASWALALVVMHAFTDSVHYAFWLSVVPEEALSGEGTLTFRQTVRGIGRDFGWVGIGLVAVATLSIGALALRSAHLARDAYFVIAGFHGYVEGAALAALFVATPSAASASERRP